MSDAKGTSDIQGSNNAQDPSMEEVLASIRRILSEEQGGSKFLQEPEDELLLDSAMLVSLANGPSQRPVVEVAFPSPQQKTSSGFEQKYDKIEQMQPPGGFAQTQVSNQTLGSASSLFQNIDMASSMAMGHPGVTLEDMVREALKPMLKAWLDENLPALVERVVRDQTKY